MHHMAAFGWDDHTPRLVQALETTAGFRLVAVGDRRASALIRARAATGTHCYQHALEMLRAARYEVALLSGVDGATQAAEAAAGAGAAVLLDGETATGPAILDAVEATLRAHVPFAVLRPRLQQAGIAFLIDLAAADSGWRPRYLDLTLTADAAALTLMRDATALTNRLFQAAPTEAVASARGADEVEDSTAVVSELRYADRRLASLRTRTAPVEQIHLYAECALGELELRADDGTATITMRFRDGRHETTRLVDRDPLAREAARVRLVVADRTGDALLAPRDGAALAALEQSLTTGQIAAVEERSSRANLVLVPGGNEHLSARRGQLRLVGA